MTQAPAPLTEDTVRQLARSLLGKAPAGPAPADDAGPGVEPVGTAVPAATWWVGARHVLRLALDRDTSVRRRRELRLRDLVRPHLPVTVPVCVAHGEWAPGLVCTLDTRVPGRPADAHEVSALGEADLAGLLTGLRDVPARQAESLGVPHVAPRSLETLRHAARAAAQRLVADDEFEAGRLHRLALPQAARLAAQPAAAVLVHHGLGAGHLVVAADGRVRGVLGWTDALLGDPAEDIALLARTVGAPAAVRAATLAGYGARPCLRGLWLARLDSVVHLADALRDRDDARLPPLRDGLRHAWEAILLERVAEPHDKDTDEQF
jgi:aminoglycoside phosphotransferase (APT) family kinase protein